MAATEHVDVGRDGRVGTHFHGTEGLQAPGPEKLRLAAGKLVPGTRYRLIRWVGEGGMGVVYEAEHVDIERRVALKILRFDLSQQPRMVQVFKDEARAAGKLGSPHVVEIYDFGELPDGRLFFAMELLDGTDLVPEEGESTEPGRLIGILRQVCKGLLAAHRQGIVHRDVKPENIITTATRTQRHTVKVVDFGISAMLAAGKENSGGIAGTPHYMAPEQILGTPFDGRLDVYSLGCTAYELLTGDPPFDAETLEDLLQQQVHEPPVAPRQLRPDLELPAALEAVVMRCLAKDPSERYADMAELEAALCEAQIDAGLVSEWDDLPLPDIADIERRERIRQSMPSIELPGPRRSLLWPLVAAASMVVAVGLGLMLALGGPTDEEASQVEALVDVAKTAASRSNWVQPPSDDPDAPTALGALQNLDSVEGDAEDLARDRAEELRAEFAGTLVRQGDYLWDHGARDLARVSYFNALVFDDEEERALERLDKTPPALLSGYIERIREGDLTDQDRLLNQLAQAQATEDPQLREALEEQAVALAEQADISPGTRVQLASMVRKDSPLQRRLERASLPEPEPEPIEETVDELPEDGSEESMEVVDEMEQPLEEEADAEAATSKRRAVRRRRRDDPTTTLGTAQRDPQKAQELADQGTAALRAGRRSEAASLFNQAISYDRRNGQALMGLSDVYFDTGQNQKAVIYAERAVKASPGHQGYRLKLGDAYYKVLRYKDALEQYEEAKKRGSGKAESRIAKVQAKLGG